MTNTKLIPIGRATVLLVFVAGFSSVLALLREVLVAAKLGASLEMDAYFFSSTFIVSLPFFTMDAINKSITPVYIHYESKDRFRMVSSIINLFVLVYLGTTLVIVLIAQLTITSFASGFNSAGQQIVSRMIWILSPTIFLIGMWGLLRSLLEAEGFFLVAAISDSFLSLIVIVLVFLGGSSLKVYSLLFGVLIAAISQFAWVAFWLWRRGFRYSLYLDLKHPALQHVLLLFWPPLMAAFLGYSIPIIDRTMASHFPIGTISALSYADKIVMSLSGILIIPLNRVLLPSLAQRSKELDRGKFNESIARILGSIFFLLTPLSIGLSALCVPIVQLFYQRGEFNALDTLITSSNFRWLVLGLMPMACAVTLDTVFCALEDTRTGSFLGVGSKFVSKILLNLVLISAFGAIGLAMASPLMYLVTGALLLLILLRQLNGLEVKSLLQTLFKTLVASLLAIVPISIIAKQLDLFGIFMILGVTFFGTLLFIVFAALLRIPELFLAYQNFLQLKHNLQKRFAVLQENSGR